MYQALYRKWRPRSFDDVISQPHITTILKNQLKENRTAHAYLFTGSRGTGKTTCARILAKSVNCTNLQPDGNPCLQCECCRDAEEGIFPDIIEIDAASNNSVDDVRDLRDATAYAPQRGKYKVYIIDEVHMLSPGAWGALLKVMEEPPEHVKFILATTEIHKVPATIISRCQRYDFHRIQTADITKRLLYVAEQEQMQVDETAAQMIAKIADGGMRDALSLLDRCGAVAEQVTSVSVANAAGVAGREGIYSILQSICTKNSVQALQEIGKLYDASKDMVRLCDELLEQLRNIMLLRAGAVDEELLTCLPDERENLEQFAKSLQLQEILRAITVLQDCRERMQRNPGKRVELEMAILQLCSTQLQMQQPVVQPQPIPMAQQPVAPQPTVEPKPTTERTQQPKLKMSDLQPIQNWADIMNDYQNINPPMHGVLANSTAYVAGNMVLIDTPNPFFLQMLRHKEHAIMLQSVLKQYLGRDFVIRARCSQEKPQESRPIEGLIQKANDSGVDTAVE